METNIPKLRADIIICKQKIREALDSDSETLYVYVELLKALRKEIDGIVETCIGRGVYQNTVKTE